MPRRPQRDFGPFDDFADALDAARELARAKLAGKIRGGDPKQTGFDHSVRVSACFTDPVLRVVGMLHDTIEDSDVTATQLLEAFGPRIASAVAALTRARAPIEDEEAYLVRVMANVDALRVKIADMQDNMVVRPGTVMSPHLQAKQLLYQREYPRLQKALADCKTQPTTG